MSDFAGSPMNRTYGNATTSPTRPRLRDRRRDARPRGPELHPGDQRDDEERHQEEEVPVLDPVGGES